MQNENMLIDRFAKRLKESYPQADRNNPCPAIYYDDFCNIVDEIAAEIDSIDTVEASIPNLFLLAEHLLANEVVIPMRCKDCKNRGDAFCCPMCFEEETEYNDGDGYMSMDFIMHDRTEDHGFCHKWERKNE